MKALLRDGLTATRCHRFSQSIISHRSFSSPSSDFKFLRITQGFPSTPTSVESPDPQVTYIAINRPDVHNAFNEHLIEEITRVFRTITKSVQEGSSDGTKSTSTTDLSSTRVVVFTGMGPSFSAGADLNWMKKMVSYTVEENERDSHLLFDMFHSMRSCPCPVVARVNGPALGGGSGLVSAADIAFAVKDAKFGFTEVKLGLIPAAISPFVLEKIGKGNASRYFLTGERFGGEEARRIGLVQECFDTEAQMDEAVKKVCKEISLSGPKAVANCKELIKHISSTNMDWSFPFTKFHTASAIAKARVSAEGQSGLSSFFNKQKPSWVKK
eukprot:TRINITY_DN5961_c0_g1_i1.p1 TRINITY_DN5961_c0_g1~~TRINITY_DN5961_c0_g1_i1.p1  ORF type:complete len:327 (-),score=59.98 TRINITY_DN5961_c0_g1_i1:24-1004(-)